MLERVWRKGNPLTLLVGMQTSTATMENSVAAAAAAAKSLQLCPTLCDPIDGSPPGSTIPGSGRSSGSTYFYLKKFLIYIYLC